MRQLSLGERDLGRFFLCLLFLDGKQPGGGEGERVGDETAGLLFFALFVFFVSFLRFFAHVFHVFLDRHVFSFF